MAKSESTNRLYVGGLPESWVIAASENSEDSKTETGGRSRDEKDLKGKYKMIETRFANFGKVTDVELHLPGGFAYVSLQATENNVRKCISVLNGSLWQGNKLRVQIAKPNYLERLKNEWEEIRQEEEKKKELEKTRVYETGVIKLSSLPRKSKKQLIVAHAPDMTPVTDEMLEESPRRRWRRGKYGIFLPVFRIYVKRAYRRKKDHRIFVFDPATFKNHIRHKFPEVESLPLEELTREIPILERHNSKVDPSLASLYVNNENDENQYVHPSDIAKPDENDLQQQFINEREASLKLLENLFSKTEEKGSTDNKSKSGQVPAEPTTTESYEDPSIEKDVEFKEIQNGAKVFFNQERYGTWRTMLSGGKEEPFSLLGDSGDQDENQEQDQMEGLKGMSQKFTLQSSANLENGAMEETTTFVPPPLFFFHFHPGRLSINSKLATAPPFYRVETEDEIQEAWEQKRSALTQEFKRKHKSAARHHRKRKPKNLGYGSHKK